MLGPLHKVAYFQSVRRTNSGIAQTPVFTPTGLASKMAKTAGAALPILKGVVVFSAMHDGQFLFDSGYHEPSGLWLETGELDIEVCDDPRKAVTFLATSSCATSHSKRGRTSPPP